ncbi:hypothetical protein D3C84_771830 [compost metagenome]
MVPTRFSAVDSRMIARAMMMLASGPGLKPSMIARYGPAPTATPAIVAHNAQA